MSALTLIPALALPYLTGACAATFSRDGQRFIVASAAACVVREYETAAFALVKETLLGGEAPSLCSRFSRGGELFACVGHTTRIFKLLQDAGPHVTATTGFVSNCRFSPDSRLLLCVSVQNTLVRLYSTDTGAQMRTFNVGAVVADASFNHDGTRILISADLSAGNTRQELWSAAASTRLRTAKLGWHSLPCAFSPNGQFILAMPANTLQLACAETGACVRALELNDDKEKRVFACAFSDCGRLLLTSSKTTIRLWDTDSGACLRISPLLDEARYHYAALGFAPDGRYAFYVSDREALVFDICTERDRCTPPPALPVPPPGLRDDMLAMLRSGEDADVVLRWADGSELRAHRNMLRRRSSLFSSRLSGRFRDDMQVVDVADDCARATMPRLLEFLYTDELTPSDADEAAALLRAAGFYGVPRLQAICEAALGAALQPENAAATLRLADALSAPALRDAALRFVATHAAAVLDTDGWRELERDAPRLAAEALRTLVTGVPPPIKTAAPTATADAQLAAAGGAAANDEQADDGGRRTRQRQQ
jgi:hypothetical protein